MAKCLLSVTQDDRAREKIKASMMKKTLVGYTLISIMITDSGSISSRKVLVLKRQWRNITFTAAESSVNLKMLAVSDQQRYGSNWQYWNAIPGKLKRAFRASLDFYGKVHQQHSVFPLSWNRQWNVVMIHILIHKLQKAVHFKVIMQKKNRWVLPQPLHWAAR